MATGAICMVITLRTSPGVYCQIWVHAPTCTTVIHPRQVMLWCHTHCLPRGIRFSSWRTLNGRLPPWIPFDIFIFIYHSEGHIGAAFGKSLVSRWLVLDGVRGRWSARFRRWWDTLILVGEGHCSIVAGGERVIDGHQRWGEVHWWSWQRDNIHHTQHISCHHNKTTTLKYVESQVS